MTANNWEDIWLMQGLTQSAERYLIGQWEGFYWAQTQAFIGNISMSRMYNVFGMPNETYATLHPVLQGSNPDDSYSIVPFEKGFQLEYYLWQNVIGEVAW